MFEESTFGLIINVAFTKNIVYETFTDNCHERCRVSFVSLQRGLDSVFASRGMCLRVDYETYTLLPVPRDDLRISICPGSCYNALNTALLVSALLHAASLKAAILTTLFPSSSFRIIPWFTT